MNTGFTTTTSYRLNLAVKKIYKLLWRHFVSMINYLSAFLDIGTYIIYNLSNSDTLPEPCESKFLLRSFNLFLADERSKISSVENEYLFYTKTQQNERVMEVVSELSVTKSEQTNESDLANDEK